MITVFGPNPAIDHTLDVPHFSAGHVWRTRNSIHLAGGKPVNVARTLSRLGTATQLVIPIGVNAGQRELFEQACSDLDIELHAVPIADNTRTCVIVADSASGEATVINEEGPHLSPGESNRFIEIANACVGPETLALGSGSLPPGLHPDYYVYLAHSVHGSGGRLIVDASGDSLRRAVGGKPWAIKVNCDEIMEMTGARTEQEAVQNVLQRGIEHVVVTRGPEGASYWGAEGNVRVSAAEVDVVNPIGSGDAFLAGLATQLLQGRRWHDALRFASAVAGLVCSRFGPDIGPQPLVSELLKTVHVI